MKIHQFFFKAIFCGMALFLALGSSSKAQLNPCAGDKVGIKSGTGNVEIQRRECDMMLVSYDKYFALEVAGRQNDSLRSQTLRYLTVVEANISLRDSIDKLHRGQISNQDEAIKGYQAQIVQYQKLADDAVRNTDYCEKRLRLAKAKTSIFAVGGGIVGILLGIVVGNSLAG